MNRTLKLLAILALAASGAQAAIPAGRNINADCSVVKGWACDSDNLSKAGDARFTRVEIWADTVMDSSGRLIGGVFIGTATARDNGGHLGVAQQCGGQYDHEYTYDPSKDTSVLGGRTARQRWDALKDGKPHYILAVSLNEPTAGAEWFRNQQRVWLTDFNPNGQDAPIGYRFPITCAPPADTQAPTVPASVSASALSTTQIKLTWNPSADNVGVKGYRVFRGGAWIASALSNSFTDGGLAPQTNYSYTVAAYDAAGNISAQSAAAVARTSGGGGDTAAPSIPTNLETHGGGPTINKLTWTAAIDNVGVAGYKILRNGSQIGTTASTYYSDETAAQGVVYSYAVAAFDAVGNASAPSAAVSSVTSGIIAKFFVSLYKDVGGQRGSLIPTDSVTAGESFFLEITAQEFYPGREGLASVRVNLLWDPKVLQEIDNPFDKVKLITPDLPFLQTGSIDPQAGRITDLGGSAFLGRAVGKDIPEWVIRLRFKALAASPGSLVTMSQGASRMALRPAGTLSDSQIYFEPQKIAVLQGAGGGLAAPSGLTATAVSPTQINLRWTDNAQGSHCIDLQRDAGTGFITLSTLCGQTSYSVNYYSNTGLTAGKTYAYRARTQVFSGGNVAYSGYANTAQAATPAANPVLQSKGLVMLIDRSLGQGAYQLLGTPGAGGASEARSLVLNASAGGSKALVFSEEVREASVMSLRGKVLAQASREGGPIVLALEGALSPRSLESGLYLILLRRDESKPQTVPLVVVR